MAVDMDWYDRLWQAQSADDAMWLLGVSARESAKAWGSFARELRKCYSGPPPLCIDGREYHRRQKRRTKRKGKR